MTDSKSMKPGKRWSFWKVAMPWLVPVLLLHAAGCAKDRASVEKSLLAQQPSAQRQQGVAEHYRAGCPDIIEVQVPQRPEFSRRYEIGADGRIDLGDYGKLRVEGNMPAEMTKRIGEAIGVPPANVEVRVVEYRSAHLLLFGEVVGKQRSIPYRGQETVLDLLHRVGGITPGAAPRDVFVVRPHLGDSQRPEVFHVDLHAIVVKHDDRTNIRLLAFDQIYVGETTQAKLEKALPPWLRRVIKREALTR